MEQNKMLCANCGAEIRLLKSTKIQLGEIGELMFSNLIYDNVASNIKAGALPVDIYMCPACGKLEFYNSEYIELKIRRDKEKEIEKQSAEKEYEIVRVRCPNCDYVYDANFMVCPGCGEQNDAPIPQLPCPFCNREHDFDDVKCPHCGKTLI